MIADEHGSYIFPRGGRQYIKLSDGPDNIVISLCTSKISSAGEVMVIDGLENDDHIFIGCSKGAVSHSDISFEYRADENLTYAYIHGVLMGDTLTTATDFTNTLRGAFAVVGDHSQSLRDNIVTVENVDQIAKAEVAAMPCFPNVLLAAIADDLEQFKNQICSSLTIESICCEGRTSHHEVHPSGDTHDHTNCHH